MRHHALMAVFCQSVPCMILSPEWNGLVNSEFTARIPVPVSIINMQQLAINFSHLYRNHTKCEIQARKLKNVEVKRLALRNGGRRRLLEVKQKISEGGSCIFLHLHTPEKISWQQALCCVPVILLLVLEPQALVLAVNNDPNKKKHLLLFFLCPPAQSRRREN